MKKIKVFMAILLSLVMTFTVFPVFASAETEGAAPNNGQTESESDNPEYEAGQLLAVVNNRVSENRIRKMAEAVGGRLIRVSPLGDGTKAVLISVNKGSEMNAVNVLSARSEVLFVQPNYKYELTENDSDYPDDPDYTKNKQEYLSADPKIDKENAGSINAAGAWKQLGNASLPDEDKILVGVIDTGARRDHVDLQGVIVKDKCVTFNNGVKMDFRAGDNSDDDIGHGTNVTGVIGANINNGIGVAGIAGGRVKIIVVDAGLPSKGINSIDIAMGIYYLTGENVRVINMSVGGHSRDYMYERAIKYAWDKGTICICSAGNDGSKHMNTPGDVPYAVNVMAHENSGEPSSFTSYGVERDVSAPGSMLYTTGHMRKSSYDYFDGTSAAAPVVTGAAALLLSADPDLTPREIKNLLYTSSGKRRYSAKKSGQGFGRINLDTAMRNLLMEKTDPDKIVINKTDINMYVGADTTIEYAVYPGNTNTVKAKFRSSNKKVVTVNSNGRLTAKAAGEAVITVSCKGVSAECKVTVREEPYKIIDRKPYHTTGRITLDELMDVIVDEDDGTSQMMDENGCYYHLYKIDLKKGETISAFMNSKDSQAYLRLKDPKGRILVSGDFHGNEEYSEITYTAKKAGTYQLQAFQVHQGGEYNSTHYDLKVTSSEAVCSPQVKSSDYGQIRLSWPAVKYADWYIVRKYKDKKKTELINEEITDATKYIDTTYDKDKVQYYTVTSCLQTVPGMIYNGESSVLAVKPVIDLSGPVFAKLRARSSKQTDKSITLKWTELKKAEKYVVYACKCSSAGEPKKLKTVRDNTVTIKKVAGKRLTKGTYYKFTVVALDKSGSILSTSKPIHVVTKGGKTGNYKGVTVSKKVLTKAKNLKKGKTLKINAKAVTQSKTLKVKQHIGLRYESTDKKIVTVTKEGVIKAKKKGTCYVYVYAQNGVFEKITVTVK